MSPATAAARRTFQTPPVQAIPFPHNPGSLMSVNDLSLEGLNHVLRRATELTAQDPLERMRLFAKRRVALLFYESSTRTRTSFELAAKALGCDTTLVSNLSSSIEKGESLKDTGLTIRALGAETIILRHNASGAPWLLEQYTHLPVLNAGDGMHEHPTQALLDLRTMLAHLRGGATEVGPETLKGVTVSITGDILHSRVARSNMLLLPRLGAEVVLCGPKELLPEVAVTAGPGVRIERDFEPALKQSHVVMMLRIQAERLAGLQLDLEEYKRAYQLTGDRLHAFAPEAIVLHPGPIIRGLEITAGVADGPQSKILEQVSNGVAIRMAVVERALSATSKGGRA
ncbi:aspartate carbamoyltransferase catalytic subunit [Occallatibacter riparius]|uniref:Aspartate carbamoyltransferase n=1 Tax=Occallatibacter riparius TaxID=1002689 RepID=A0A9J7BTF6_9BACT|nr:aspartate carbamoyltransferase catalytic subunit [Occallatibacter riparius]UWZ86156.1 aspartate carbamoyltransferase catalytic subunit [Occallatibacter riparius]